MKVCFDFVKAGGFAKRTQGGDVYALCLASHDSLPNPTGWRRNAVPLLLRSIRRNHLTTAPTQPQPFEAALDKAWRSEGREHFSLCHRCGRWVSDLMYNPNTLQCVDCSPWEEQPAFCPHCGTRVRDERTFCLACGKRLQYGGEESDGST